ncbi:MAG: hypothetical protein JWQ81_2656 [Amycolatopsis sp.]|uniref:hypothetical protein n=1 Tax=Amycolatopsis sp. TaxID=37632 RepID=UPI0026348634|nr:hypothetical protein [Amycolatopsis sp.]MCU1681917.1 hypothetical protein [Amycolatopsis sp.]
MAGDITADNFFREILDQVPEFEWKVNAERKSITERGGDPEDVDHLKYNPYSLAFELFTGLVVPALRATDAMDSQEDFLARCFTLLERAAATSDSYVRDNMALAVADFLVGDLGPTAYAHAGLEFRALMAECLADEGLEIPASWL